MGKIKQGLIGLMTFMNLLMVNMFGMFTTLLYMDLGLMLLDLLTRVYAASVRSDERAESRKVLQGLYRKIGLCILIVLSLILDYGLKEIVKHLGIDVSTKIMFTALTLAWLFVREFISNLENLQWAGIELPAFILKAVTITEEKVDKMGENIIGKDKGKE